MSATETQISKRDRACDACRRRKIKCNGPPDSVCANCYRTGKPCTYIEASKPRGPSKAYVTSLEDRLEVLEGLLRQIQPSEIVSELFGRPVIRDSWKDENALTPAKTQKLPLASNIRSVPSPILSHLGGELANPNIISLDSSSSAHVKLRSQSRAKRAPRNAHVPESLSNRAMQIESDEDTNPEISSSSETEDAVITSFGGRTKITLLATAKADSAVDSNIRFHGRSDTAGLIELTRQFKDMHVEETIDPVAQKTASQGQGPRVVPAQTRRLQFWKTPSWELGYESIPPDDSRVLRNILEQFPHPDLANQLIDHYFQHSNPVFPLLHRPTFQQQWSEQLHRRNIWFACVCASLFAVASRWCHHDRIALKGRREDAEETDWAFLGRQYFEMANEIHHIRRSLLQSASLFEVQSLVLMVMYLSGSNAYPSAWVLVSTALRKAEDVGAHRKRVYQPEPNIDDELWKRAFWILVIIDRIQAAVLGRNFMLGDEDFDVDLPLEVDDDHGELSPGTKPFTQQTGISNALIAFNRLIKLIQIMALALRILYPVDKSQVCYGIITLERKDAVRYLSRALDGWEANLPENLRWRDDINVRSPSQSSNLFIIYHMTRILVHRLLITSWTVLPVAASSARPRNSRTPLAPSYVDSSIEICAAALQSCSRILDAALFQDFRYLYPPFAIYISYNCAAFISRIAWQTKLQEEEFLREGKKNARKTDRQGIEEKLPHPKIFLRILEALGDCWDIADLLLKDIGDCLSGLDDENRITEAPSVSADIQLPTASSRVMQIERRRKTRTGPAIFVHPSPQLFPFTEGMSSPDKPQASTFLGRSANPFRSRTVSLASRSTHRDERLLAKSYKLVRTVSSPDLIGRKVL